MSVSVEQAALNNALWCDAVCSTHAGPGEFRRELWINPRGAPLFYPDVITLLGAEAAMTQRLAIETLVRADAGKSLAVKDSFQTLDLRDLGFAPLFDAHWIVANDREPASGSPLRSRRVEDKSALEAWEAAWRGGEDAPRIFRPGLLSRSDIHVLAVARDGVLVGGGVLNHGAGVVGVTNVFGSDGDGKAIWNALASAARSTFPGSPVVGYERDGECLDAAFGAGFATFGALRIWRRA